MRWLRLAWRLPRLVAVLLLGVLFSLLLALVEPLWRGDRLALRLHLTRRFHAALAAALPFRVTLIGEIPREPRLWVGNHVSWTDIPLLGRLLPLAFLAKAEVRGWPLLGWLAEQGGTLFIRRGGGDSAKIAEQLAERLGRPGALALFPEGTSTDGTQVRTFHGRLLGSATQAGVPLQPVAIRYLRGGRIDPLAPFIGDDELPGHLLRLLGAEVAEVQIHLLPPIDSRGRSRDDLARLSQQAVAEALGLRVPPSPPAPLPSRERGDGACRPA